MAAVRGETIWEPLAGTRFAAACTRTTPAGLAVRARAATAVVAVKPLAESLGLAVRARAARPTSSRCRPAPRGGAWRGCRRSSSTR
ncbi:hypothetical protein ABT369_35175 [Dactylosporangium sp. NPDC000244]|uniref:hypothetical protein n=1 Tax=Dactylosporangium sp. NPDC000244 TaxID=3154365 RepID=UPI003321084E